MKTEKLVGIGASVVANCMPCIKYNLKAAKESGATEEEIRNVIELAKAIKMKSTAFMDIFAEEILSRSRMTHEEECYPEQKDSEVNKKCCVEVGLCR